MEIIKLDIDGLLLIKPRVFEDERGYFFESFISPLYKELGLETAFVQDNESKSKKDVVRGLHFQNHPFAQGKLVRVIHGSVLDVAVDIRKNSPTYGKWRSVKLSSDNKLMYWIPVGFAHGFCCLEDDTILTYKCTSLYNKESEGSIRWNAPDLNINWEVDQPVVSAKDNEAPLFKDFVSLF